MVDIGQKIKKVRELKGYTQEYLAQQLDISQKTYSQIENNQGKLDVERLQKIAEALEVNLIELLTFDDKNIFNNTFNDKVENSQNYVVNQYLVLKKNEKPTLNILRILRKKINI